METLRPGLGEGVATSEQLHLMKDGQRVRVAGLVARPLKRARLTPKVLAGNTALRNRKYKGGNMNSKILTILLYLVPVLAIVLYFVDILTLWLVFDVYVSIVAILAAQALKRSGSTKGEMKTN